MKRNVYLSQVNYNYGKNCFLPYSVGLLQAYAESIPEIRSEYEFKEFFFLREDPVEVVKRLESPAVFGFSCYIWNWEHNLQVAKLVKEAYPECLIVLGGPHVPKKPLDFFKYHEYIDILVHSEGEISFSKILLEALRDFPCFTNIAGLSVRGDRCVSVQTLVGDRISDLSELRSPYLDGVFDELSMEQYSFHASQETNRGCPYSCLTAESVVYTEVGLTALTDVRPGDRILGWENGRAVWNRVHVLFSPGYKPVFRLVVGDKIITATEDHPIYTSNGIKQLGELNVGDSIIVQDLWKAMPTKKRDMQQGMCSFSKNEMASRFSRSKSTSMCCMSHKDNSEETWGISEDLFPGLCSCFNQGIKNRRSESYEARGRSSKSKPEDVTAFRETLSVAKREACCRNKKGYSGAWAILASGRFNQGRIDGLRKSGLEVFYHLRQRQTNQETCSSIERVRCKLEVVSSKVFMGYSRVFDIDACPTHNFFVNGVLVGNCTFCDWGSAVFQKLRTFPLDRIASELEWMAKHKIELLYNCDANFGIFPRDAEIAEALVKSKEKYGFPKQFRAAWAKKGEDKLYPIAKMLNDAGLCKGVTLSFQSMDESTLATIKRKNIGVETFERLMSIYNRDKIPTYTELIMGLPGETYESFCVGIEKLLSAGQHDSLQIYLCAALPNSEMSDLAYVKKHGIKTVRMPILLQHRSSRENDITEYNDIVVETKTLSLVDWKRTYLFAWVVQSFHCLGLTQSLAIVMKNKYGISYRDFYNRLLTLAATSHGILGDVYRLVSETIENALSGGKWDIVLPEFGDTIWPSEEATFLLCVKQKDDFYHEIWTMLRHLPGRYDSETFQFLTSLLHYQKNTIQYPGQFDSQTFETNYNFSQYLDGVRSGESVMLRKGKFEVRVHSPLERGTLQEYAQNVVWYGRKGGSTRFKDILEREIL